MFDWLHGALGLILGFSGLIFVHEFGHFVLAKWHSVRVYVFSLGMGPYLATYTWRGTVYALSLIPIGGYVKLMGQDDLNPNAPPSRDKDDYRNKRPGQKAAILAAGAIFNLLFTVFAFALCYWQGMPVGPPRIGNVAPGTPLAAAVLHPMSENKPAKLQPGDRILEVNGVPVKTYVEVLLQVSGARKGQDLYLKIDRLVDLVVVKARHDKKFGASSIGLDNYYEEVPLPLGFTTEDRVVIDPTVDKKMLAMPAAQAGLAKDDEVREVADPDAPDGPVVTEVKDIYDFVNAVRGSGGRTLTLTYLRNGERKTARVTPVKPADAEAYQIGVRPDMRRYVVDIDKDSEAYGKGLRDGCFVLGFIPDDPNVENWKEWKSGRLVWKKEAGGRKIETRLTVPTSGRLVFTQTRQAVERLKADNLGTAMGMAWDDTVRFSGSVFIVLRGLFTGDVSFKALSGPLGIGGGILHIAASQTFLNYLWFLGFISLNLGVLQFVPIPLLDGWHLLMVLIEKVKGSPVPMRVQEAFQYVGLFIIAALLILATYNDIARFFPK
ncbi:MAG: RIP metalloprotease RseP [Planctomycetota bacterium]|nr:RIP metalloprotease RseP [Planctomycetota bacterium]